MNLSFAGCGFMGIYHVGVAVAFKKYAPHLLLEKISGASAGALAATSLLCNMPLGEMTSDFFRVVNEARSHSLKAFSPSFNIQTCLLEGLDKFLPENAHELVNGKLHISLTRFWGRKNVIVSHFDSREELLQALLCACWIPVFSGYMAPKFRGVRYMDGGFSDNLPVLDENTVTVSPFCGESDICPRDDSAQLFHLNLVNTSIEVSLENMGRIRRILIPPKPEELSNMCQQGFDDALQFLHRNNLINCTRCLAVQSTFIVQETLHESKDYDPECVECVKHRKDVLVGNHMPETVLTVFQTYIDSANIGLAKWIFKYRGWKLLQTLSLPATVPADMICATLTKLLLITNRLASIVGDTMERRPIEMWVLANYIYQAQPVVLPQHLHVHRHRDALECESDAVATMFDIRRVLYRILATTPCLRERFWYLADFIIEQINLLNSIIQSQRTQKMSANISCQLSLTECGKQKVKTMTHRSSKLDILINDNEIVSTIDRLQQQQQSSGGNHHVDTSTLSTAIAADALTEALLHGNSHKHSIVSSTTVDSEQHTDSVEHPHPHGDIDSFDHILQATSHHEAVYAYYYMDENNKVKVTEIFDMTDNEDPDMQTMNERATNQQLQFDHSEWDAIPADNMHGGSSDRALDQSSSEFTVVDDNASTSGRTSSGHQHHAHRIRRHSAARGEHELTVATTVADIDATTYDQFLDDFLMDDDYPILDKTYFNQSLDSTNDLTEPSSGIRSNSSDTQWSSDDDDEAGSPSHCSDPEVDQIINSSTGSSTSFTSSHLSERALRALNRPSHYPSTNF